jgi:peptide/nickel transport system permease protein
MKAIIPLLAFLLIGFVAIPPLLIYAGKARDPYAIRVEHRLQAPSVSQPFGTDDLGRDHLARTLLATGLSLSVAGRAFFVALLLAMVLGTIAGYTARRWPDRIISYIIAVVYTVPFILLAVALAAVLRAGLGTIYLIVGCIAWAPPARLVRAEVMRLRNAKFITAERAYGFPACTIFLRSLLPLTLIPPFVSLLYLTPELVGLDVGLSFFGLGAQPPTPTLGRLIFDGLTYLRSGWWISLLPACGLVLIFACLYGVLRYSYQKGLLHS